MHDGAHRYIVYAIEIVNRHEIKNVGLLLKHIKYVSQFLQNLYTYNSSYISKFSVTAHKSF